MNFWWISDVGLIRVTCLNMICASVPVRKFLSGETLQHYVTPLDHFGPSDSLLITLPLLSRSAERPEVHFVLFSNFDLMRSVPHCIFFPLSVLLNSRSDESSHNNGLWSVFPPGLKPRQWDQMRQSFKNTQRCMHACVVSVHQILCVTLSLNLLCFMCH